MELQTKMTEFAGPKGLFWVSAFLLFFLVGCGPSLSSPEQVAVFMKAGPIETTRDVDSLVQGKPGPYRVISGDVLEFQMHVSLRIVSTELIEWLKPNYANKDIDAYLVRISDAGTITLPVIGEIHVANKTLAEIEEQVRNEYYPKYVVTPPMLICQVEKYQGEHERVFTVMGLVNKPDAYDYPPDVEYNLIEALAFAGGLDMVADPKFVKVLRQDADGEVLQATFGVDDKSLQFSYSVAIKPGDVIYVNHTLSTRINKFLSDVFHITVGATSNSSLD